MCMYIPPIEQAVQLWYCSSDLVPIHPYAAHVALQIALIDYHGKNGSCTTPLLYTLQSSLVKADVKCRGT